MVDNTTNNEPAETPSSADQAALQQGAQTVVITPAVHLETKTELQKLKDLASKVEQTVSADIHAVVARLEALLQHKNS